MAGKRTVSAGGGGSIVFQQLEASRGGLLGVRPFLVPGKNADIDSAAAEDISDKGGLHVLPTEARLHNIVSTDNIDDVNVTGDGAWIVFVAGYVENGSFKVEQVQLNGTTPVPTVNKFLWIEWMATYSSGGNNIPTGQISATAQVDGTVTCIIPAGKNLSANGAAYVPEGHTMIISGWTVNLCAASGTSTRVDSNLVFITRGLRFDASDHITIDRDSDNYFSRDYGVPINFDASVGSGGVLIAIQADTTTNDTSMTCSLNGMVVKTPN
jgi:hypothetical protein